MALRLVYLMLVRVLGWLVLLACSDAAKDAEIRRCGTRSRYCAVPTPDRRRPILGGLINEYEAAA